MYEICLRGNLPDANDLLSRNDTVRLKRCIFAQGNQFMQLHTSVVKTPNSIKTNLSMRLHLVLAKDT